MGTVNGTTADCCPEETGYNPKTSRAARERQRERFRFATPKNPVPAQIEDAEEYKEFFSLYREVFVPYAGTDETTSHSLLHFLINLVDLSPTQGAVIRSLKSHAFGGKLKIKKRFDPVFELEGQGDDPSVQEKVRYYEFLQRITVFDNAGQEIDLRKFGSSMFEDLKSNGNFYAEIVRGEVAGEKFFHIHVQRPEHCLFLATDKGEQRYIAISPIWDRHYIWRKPPDVIPLYPTWENYDGAERTIVQVKTGGTWYGRPDSLSSMLYQFLEFQNADYLNKQTAANFTGQAFIEIEMGNPEHEEELTDAGAIDNGYEDFADQFEDNYTNRGQKPQSVIVSARPYGAKPAYVFQFTPNTNEKWYQVTNQEAADAIIKSHGWSKRFIGEEVSSGLSTNVYLDEFEISSVTTVREVQEWVQIPVNNIFLQEAVAFFEEPEMENYSLEFSSPFADMLEERKNQSQNNNNTEIEPGNDNNNGVGSGEVRPGE